MGHATATYREVRFIISDELLDVYTYIEAGGDAPHGVQGWHHKTFPASLDVLSFMREWADGKHDPILWSLEAPRQP